MKQVILCIVGLALYPIAGVNGQNRKIVQGAITKDAIVSDLDDYKNCIDKNHINPYTAIKRDDFFEQVNQLKKEADNYNIDELYVKWLQINAKIQDGHTGIQGISKDMFPFYAHWYDEGLYIIATNDENRKFYHSKIVAINDLPLTEIASRIVTIMPEVNNGEIRERIPHFIIDPFILHGLKISTDRNKVTYTVITPQNETLKMSPALIDKRDANMLTGQKTGMFLRNSVSGKYWFKYIDSNKSIYFNYSSCVDNGNFPHIIDELKKTIEEKQPQKIVIDIRYNSGGNSNLLKPFIDYLSRSPLNKKGSLYVLIGRKTYASAILNAVSLKRQTNALFVGEATGGEVDHFGEAKSYTLPETKLKLYYSTKRFESYEKYDGAFKPDVTIIETFADYNNNIDAVADYAMGQ